VGPESATLNARGTADNGPAHSYFEYWPSGGAHSATDTRRWPSGASGPFSEKVDRLYAGKTYLFRVCGADGGSGGTAVCAQTRQFATPAPVQDSAVGFWSTSPGFEGGVNAHSGPIGQNAHGTASLRWSFDTFTGNVTCLLVQGNKATVGAVGHTHESADAKETLLLTVVDGGPSGATDTVLPAITKGSTAPPGCANASFANQIDVDDALTVNDAP
jgi:hypothetical protein